MKEPPVNGMTVVPTGGDWMCPAWASFVLWAATNDEILNAFHKATKLDARALESRSGLIRAIDEATGFEREIVLKFLDFATLNYWGTTPDRPCASAATAPASGQGRKKSSRNAASQAGRKRNCKRAASGDAGGPETT